MNILSKIRQNITAYYRIARDHEVLHGEIFNPKDYLLYRRGCPPEAYSSYRMLCSDMRLLAARKLWTAGLAG